jgi:hypothetical protein
MNSKESTESNPMQIWEGEAKRLVTLWGETNERRHLIAAINIIWAAIAVVLKQ